MRASPSTTAFFLCLLAGGAFADVPQAVHDRFPGAVEIAEAPLPGLYEVREGYQIRYVDAEGRLAFLFGDITDLATGENLTENRRRAFRRELFEDIDRWDPIDFVPEDAAHTIAVFTDIDCGYCRQLHAQRAAYNELGIGIRYFAFPRAGLDSQTAANMTSIWCAEDRREAMTRAKRGESLPHRLCPAPIASHAQLGRQLGLRGTPMLLTGSGEIINGYVAPQALLQILDPGGAENAATR